MIGIECLVPLFSFMKIVQVFGMALLYDVHETTNTHPVDQIGDTHLLSTSCRIISAGTVNHFRDEMPTHPETRLICTVSRFYIIKL